MPRIRDGYITSHARAPLGLSQAAATLSRRLRKRQPSSRGREPAWISPRNREHRELHGERGGSVVLESVAKRSKTRMTPEIALETSLPTLPCSPTVFDPATIDLPSLLRSIWTACYILRAANVRRCAFYVTTRALRKNNSPRMSGVSLSPSAKRTRRRAVAVKPSALILPTTRLLRRVRTSREITARANN